MRKHGRLERVKGYREHCGAGAKEVARKNEDQDPE